MSGPRAFLLLLITIVASISTMAVQLDPISILKGKESMNDSILKEAYKKIHNYYIAFAPDSAILYNQIGLRDAEERENDLFIAYVCENLAVCHIHIGDYGNAQLYATRGLTLYEEEGDLIGQANLCNSMGVIFGANGDHEKSLEYYNKAIDLNKKNEEFLKMAINLGNLSGVYLERGNLGEAKRCVEEALVIYIENQDSMLQSTALNNMGEVYLRMGMMDSASIYLHRAKKLKEILGLQQRLPVTLNLLGDAYLITGVKDSVPIFYRSALRIADSLSMTLESRMSLKGLYEYYKSIGDVNSALQYHEEYMALNDSIYNTQKDRQIKELEIRYQVEKKNSAIELLNSKILLQKRLRNLGILLLALAGALFIVTYNRIRLKSLLLEKENELEKEKSRQLKYELEENNRKLMAQSMLSIQKNQLLNDIKEKLTTIEGPCENINQAMKLVEETHSADKEWENLKIHFESVHPGFFTKLQEVCPELTSTDLRHCAYIKIQMSTKDVARIMNVDPKSVKMTRYRLKKKLSLSEEDSLENYLINF